MIPNHRSHIEIHTAKAATFMLSFVSCCRETPSVKHDFQRPLVVVYSRTFENHPMYIVGPYGNSVISKTVQM